MKSSLKNFLLFILCGIFSQPSWARNAVDYFDFASQTDFREFAVDLTGVLGSQTLYTGEALQWKGLDIGVTGSYSKLLYQHMNQVSHDGYAYTESSRFSIQKGLPYRFNIALEATNLGNLTVIGSRVTANVLSEETHFLNLSLVGFYDQLLANSKIGYSDQGGELVISKTYFNTTPFLSIGRILSQTTPKAANLQTVALHSQTASLSKEAIGFRLNKQKFDYTFAYNQIHGTSNFSFKLGYRF